MCQEVTQPANHTEAAQTSSVLQGASVCICVSVCVVCTSVCVQSWGEAVVEWMKGVAVESLQS